ncbi:MAG TPA: TetR/AcrR family transcriptional regulator [Cryobacterium sp.]|nr:TetR/AcrR family transcriptional regulator [Cryobacterium sp.]
MSSDRHAGEGLRARKRAATQAALERAGIALALEHGYENVTVDAICEAAMVSPRTFFNYFGTKEAVFLGAPPSRPTDAAINAFVHAAGSNVLGDLARMVTSALVGPEPDLALLRSRRSLIERTPELLTNEITRVAEMETILMRMVLDRFQAQGRGEATTPDLADEAHMVVALWASLMRYSMQKWFSGGFTGTPRELLDHSIELIGRIAGPDRPSSRG